LSNPTQDQKEAGLMQMKINTRLTALQTALSIMGTHGYTGIAGEKPAEDAKYPGQREAVWVKQPGAVDHITLLAMAGDIEKYISGDLAEEARKAIDEAAKRLNAPKIVRP
jgi:hypothetical protein